MCTCNVYACTCTHALSLNPVKKADVLFLLSGIVFCNLPLFYKVDFKN